MEISVRSQHMKPRRRLTLAIQKILEQSLDRFSARIRGIDVSLNDTNGPKGGIDKRCTVRVNLIPRGMVVISEEGTRIANTLRRAIRRVIASLSRKSGKMSYGR